MGPHRAEEVISGWSDVIAAGLPTGGPVPIRDVFVYAETASTQDAAWRHRRADGGVVVVSSVQTAGRGQRGRRWHDGRAMSLPVSFALPLRMGDAGLAARAGLATIEACRSTGVQDGLGIKWPNDVVTRGGAGERKLAGVLVERRDAWAIVGVGINVFQTPADFADLGLANACSLATLGGRTDRLALGVALVDTVARWLVTDDAGVRAAWAESDTMLGTARAFRVGQDRVEGVVTALDPLGSITVQTADGARRIAVETARVEPVSGTA